MEKSASRFIHSLTGVSPRAGAALNLAMLLAQHGAALPRAEAARHAGAEQPASISTAAETAL